ncbi:MAG: serine/threonine-protein kinase [bacterium]|nr:serine/threonine protein kinase [Myxococcales bacterium]MCB9552678.1 serine/threonine protein kinase [Myxococcales bacterium]
MPTTLEAALPTRPVRLGRYALLDRVGAGAMGLVYAAYDDVLDRKVAIKLLRDDGPKSEDRARIRREAKAMARLSHPNVAQIYEAGEYRDRLYLAMEYVPGESLDVWQSVEPRPWEAILAMYLEVGRGLAAAHAAGVLHRDFKPHNVLIGDDGRPRVIDFGLARPVGEAEAPRADGDRLEDSLDGDFSLDVPVTRTGTVVGTPAYMSLEQFQGKPLDAASDQFAFCVALYEALYGAPPYPRDQLPHLLAALTRHAVQPPPPDTRVPAWLHHAIVRGLAPDPAHRWPSMPALLAELARDREHDPDTARPGRLLFVASIAAVIFVSTLHGVFATGLDIPTARRAFTLAAIVGGGVALALLAMRQAVWASAFNRRITVFFLAAIGVVIALRGVTWALGADPRPTFVFELCALAALAVVATASIARWFAGITAVLLTGVVAAITVIDYLVPIYAAATVAGSALAVHFTRARRPRRPPEVKP